MECARVLTEEKVETKKRVTALESELLEAQVHSDVLNAVNAKLQERVRSVKRVNALLTDNFNSACMHQQ